MLSLLVIAIAVWSVGYGMEFFSPSLTLKMWWVRFEYFGNIWLGPICLYFILSITKKGVSRHKGWFLLCLPPLIFLVLVLTNPHHHLMWERAWIHWESPIPVLIYDRGSGFWAFVVYSYLLILAATILLIKKYIKTSGIYKRQLAIVTLGIAFPWLANIIYIFGFEHLKYIDFTPTAFTISGILFFWGLIRYQKLSMIPLAQETIINSMGDPVIAVDMEGCVLYMNQAALHLVQTDSITPAHHHLDQYLPCLSEFILTHADHSHLEAEAAFSKGFETGSWDVRIFPLHGRKEKALGRLLILKDITGKKKAENEAKESLRIQRVILNASPNPIVQYNQNGEVIYLNPAFTKIFGWTLDELRGKRIDFVPEENREETKIALRNTLENPEGNYDFVTQRLTKGGRVLDVSINSTQHRPEDGSPPSMVVNFTDITHIKKTERELRKAGDYISSIINSLPSMLIGLDAEGTITHWNIQAEKMTGVAASHAIGCGIKEVASQLASHVSDLESILESRKPKKESKIRLIFKDRVFLTDIAIYPIQPESTPGVVIRVDDISERVKIEEMMIQSEKMMSVGGLAAGMAHEINNPLAGIIQNTQVIKNRLIRPLPANIEAARDCGIDLERLNDYMEKRNIFTMMNLVIDSGLRAAHIVENMLSFSRKSGHRKSTHYLHDIMENTLELVGNDYNLKKRYDFRNIHIHKDYRENAPPVVCEKNKIQQVFLNILKNGAEAMAEAETQAPQFFIRCYKEGEAAVIEIEDNGPGMDRDTLKRIFEPFFTTKEVGLGTGLGLSVSYFIITEDHDGLMTVDAALGKGTLFTIKLPLHQTRKL
jgi:PAS domain S-box-containing protein